MDKIPLIELRGVCKEYTTGGPSIKALKKISLKIFEGDFLILEGKSGSGKTTLLNLISGIDCPTSGSVIFEGRDLSSYHEGEIDNLRNKKLGFIFQFFNLLPNLTAIQNTVLPLYINNISRIDAYKRAGKMLKFVGLEKRKDNKVFQLSGGEQQRVAIARALVNNPKLLICDEPTGNLDSENGKIVIDIIKKLNKNGTTVLLATHDADLKKASKKIITLKDGKLL